MASSGIDRVSNNSEQRGLGDSFSGHERDHFFVNLAGERFIDLGGIYGMDHPGDGRTIAMLDHDRDGWMDFAVASSNKPSLQLFRNKIGELSGSAPRFVALRLEGGARGLSPEEQLSPREGYGARVEVVTAQGTQALEARCGEGRSATHARTLIVGLGEAALAERVTVRWPSGRESVVEAVPSGTLLSVYELAEQSPDGSGEARAPYRAVERASAGGADRSLVMGAEGDELRVLVTMTTTCAACLRAKPKLKKLKEACAADGVSFYGVPVDLDETAETLAHYVEQREPPYEVLVDLEDAAVDELRAVVRAELGYESTPCTVVTNGRGEVLDVRAGIPSLSVLRKCLDEEAMNQ
ncbi:MAG: ASPIC/UnbV domain-containing protein [Planctomycetes bacterium]|nr:ASPIC/UnbV domain-containing protein [Planctomycetota bacterium]